MSCPEIVQWCPLTLALCQLQTYVPIYANLCTSRVYAISYIVCNCSKTWHKQQLKCQRCQGNVGGVFRSSADYSLAQSHEYPSGIWEVPERKLPASEMTYIVSGGALKLHSLTRSLTRRKLHSVPFNGKIWLLLYVVTVGFASKKARLRLWPCLPNRIRRQCYCLTPT